ncbi:hypothetical protein BKA70DRAFT_1226142 [Coprinopsis sp. MPI-PUGE-AT-0042]|nr:hypothetical protein BKA70DRAFT_1226142 [Coprinopsis sp. MPI-PUGE-AT-0042]
MFTGTSTSDGNLGENTGGPSRAWDPSTLSPNFGIHANTGWSSLQPPRPQGLSHSRSHPNLPLATTSAQLGDPHFGPDVPRSPSVYGHDPHDVPRATLVPPGYWAQQQRQIATELGYQREEVQNVWNLMALKGFVALRPEPEGGFYDDVYSPSKSTFGSGPRSYMSGISTSSSFACGGESSRKSTNVPVETDSNRSRSDTQSIIAPFQTSETPTTPMEPNFPHLEGTGSQASFSSENVAALASPADTNLNAPPRINRCDLGHIHPAGTSVPAEALLLRPPAMGENSTGPPTVSASASSSTHYLPSESKKGKYSFKNHSGPASKSPPPPPPPPPPTPPPTSRPFFGATTTTSTCFKPKPLSTAISVTMLFQSTQITFTT